VLPVPTSLEADAAFKSLSPEAQYWVRIMTQKLHEAIEQWGIKALDEFKLTAAQGELAGTKFCGEHTFGQWTFLEAVALNESRKEEVFVATWLEHEDGSGEVHSAVFTDKRCIAIDGQVVDGKLISKILPSSLAASRQNGLVAYEAYFFDHPAEAPGGAQFIQRGVFIENRFFVGLGYGNGSVPSRSVRDEGRDFWWSDQQERLEMRSGVALDPATALVVPMQAKEYLAPRSATPSTQQPTAPPAPDCAETPKAKKPRFGLHLPPSVPKTIDHTLRKTVDKSGVQVDPKAPNDVLKEAQKAKVQPCPIVPATAPAEIGEPPTKQ
jgi:hypothetical protein